MRHIVIGALFIIGGLSGQFALRGTNSPIALVVVGAGLVIWGFIAEASERGARGKRPTAKRGGARPAFKGAPAKRPVLPGKAKPMVKK